MTAKTDALSDRELLELAAKAAGEIGAYVDTPDCIGIQVIRSTEHIHVRTYWNPLTDDGDALRLAVKLGILIAPPAYNGGWEATASAKADDGRWIDETLGTHGESTRRAIVRAAAEIGRSMP
jgi:hypothetical protein